MQAALFDSKMNVRFYGLALCRLRHDTAAFNGAHSQPWRELDYPSVNIALGWQAKSLRAKCAEEEHVIVSSQCVSTRLGLPRSPRNADTHPGPATLSRALDDHPCPFNDYSELSRSSRPTAL